MADGHWSGITGRGNAYEDFAVQESMGAIVDRSQEYLGTCDRVIYRARQLLLEAVRRTRDTGALSFVGDDIDYAASARSASPIRARRTGARSIRTSCAEAAE
jgi:hypothetical protein